MIRRLLKDSTLYTVPVVVARGLNFLLLPIYTRILTPDRYGALDLLMVFGSLVNLLLPLEISQGAARFTAESAQDPTRQTMYASTALRFAAAGYALFCVVFLLAAPAAAELLLGHASDAGIFRLTVIFIALNGLHGLLLNQLKWELRSSAYTANHLAVALGSPLASLLLAYGFGRGLTGVLEGMIAGAALGLGLGVAQLRERLRGRFDAAALREMLAYSAPLAVAAVGVFVNTYVDRVMLSRLLSLESVGLYGLALRLAGVASLATVGVQGALSPLILSRHAHPETKTELARFFRLFVSGALLLVLFLALFSPEILRLMATPAFYGAAPLVPWLASALLLSGLYVFTPGLTLAKKSVHVLVLNVGGGLLNLGLNFLLIPRFGMAGAAYATCAAAAAVFAAYFVLSHREYPVSHDGRRLLLGLGVVVGLAALGARIPGPALGVALAKTCFFAAAVAALLGIGLVRRYEWQAAWSRVRG